MSISHRNVPRIDSGMLHIEETKRYVNYNFHMEVLNMPYQLKNIGIYPNKWVFVSIFKACKNLFISMKEQIFINISLQMDLSLICLW